MSCCAIIVSYHPTEELIENIDALVNQVDEIIIVDNGSGLATKQLLDHLIKQHSKLNVILLQENLGIAAALNVGVRKAKAAGYEWMITFDQDSQATLNMVASLFEVYASYSQKEKIASLSPRYMDRNTGEIIGSRGAEIDKLASYIERDVVITSGNLVKLKIFEELGDFDEKLFIDSVDTEYCLRCISAGYKILEVKNALLIHSIGLPTRIKFLWGNYSTTNHSNLRRYYISRNSIHVYKKYIFKQPKWIIKNSYYLSGHLSKAIIFEKNRWGIFSAIFSGFFDGLIGRFGQCTRGGIKTKLITPV